MRCWQRSCCLVSSHREGVSLAGMWHQLQRLLLQCKLAPGQRSDTPLLHMRKLFDCRRREARRLPLLSPYAQASSRMPRLRISRLRICLGQQHAPCEPMLVLQAQLMQERSQANPRRIKKAQVPGARRSPAFVPHGPPPPTPPPRGPAIAAMRAVVLRKMYVQLQAEQTSAQQHCRRLGKRRLPCNTPYGLQQATVMRACRRSLPARCTMGELASKGRIPQHPERGLNLRRF